MNKIKLSFKMVLKMHFMWDVERWADGEFTGSIPENTHLEIPGKYFVILLNGSFELSGQIL
jgi:hypothetical protein